MPHRLLAVPFVLALLAAGAHAEVLRCTDAAGKVSYTDGACPSGSKGQRQVQTQAPVNVLPDPAGDARAAAAARAPQRADAQREAPPASPAGAVVMDSRGNASAETEPPSESRWNTERGSDTVVVDDGSYGVPYAGARRPPPRIDKRALPRDCENGSCRDGMGNTYNSKNGQLQRYQSIDGKTCRPVNSTVVCK